MWAECCAPSTSRAFPQGDSMAEGHPQESDSSQQAAGESALVDAAVRTLRDTMAAGSGPLQVPSLILEGLKYPDLNPEALLPIPRASIHQQLFGRGASFRPLYRRGKPHFLIVIRMRPSEFADQGPPKMSERY